MGYISRDALLLLLSQAHPQAENPEIPHVWRFAGQIPQDGTGEVCLDCGAFRSSPTSRVMVGNAEVYEWRMTNIWQILEEEIRDDIDAETVFGGDGAALKFQLEAEEVRASHTWLQGRGVATRVAKDSHTTVACVWEICKICGAYREGPSSPTYRDESMAEEANFISCEEMVVQKVLSE